MANAIVKISKEAKRLQRLHHGWTWKECISKASANYNAGQLGTIGKAKPKKKGKVKSKASYRQTGTSNKFYDEQRSARKPGARIPAGGKHVTYYERRKNRSDAPGKLTGTPQTAYNEMIIRRMTEANRNLDEGEKQLTRLKDAYKRAPKGMGKKLIQRNIKEQKKYIGTVKHTIRMLKALVK